MSKQRSAARLVVKWNQLATTKDEMRKLVDALPDDATWEDVQCSIYVRERVERGRREVTQGKILEQDAVEARLQR